MNGINILSIEQEEQRGPSLEIDLPVTLEDLYNGKTFQVLHKKQILCPKCRGTGAKVGIYNLKLLLVLL